MSGVHYDRVCRLLREVFQEHREKTIGYQLAVKSKLYELMLIILREMPKTEPKISPAKSKYICDYITKNFDNPDLTLEKAAGTFNLSKFYFSHFFKKTTGYTFYDYLTATRINFAKQYLTETNMTITDAAFRSGFNTLQTFNRVFKTLTGFTPGNYRRENSIVTPKTTDRRD